MAASGSDGRRGRVGRSGGFGGAGRRAAESDGGDDDVGLAGVGGTDGARAGSGNVVPQADRPALSATGTAARRRATGAAIMGRPTPTRTPHRTVHREPPPRVTRTAAASAAAPGANAEQRALTYLESQGLRLVHRNYRVAGGPGRPAGEIDLVMRARDGTLVFVEVRARRSTRLGGAAASVHPAKQARLVFAARCYLARLPAPPPCRFDVVAIDGPRLTWLPAAFDAG